MNMISTLEAPWDRALQSVAPADRQALVVIVSDCPETAQQVAAVCEFFDLAVETVGSAQNLMEALGEARPMAVIADLEGSEQDGFFGMQVIASYDRELPVMVLTGGDSAMMGATDAVQDLWNLSTVSSTTASNLAGQLAEFLFMAGRRAGCMRLVQV